MNSNLCQINFCHHKQTATNRELIVFTVGLILKRINNSNNKKCCIFFWTKLGLAFRGESSEPQSELKWHFNSAKQNHLLVNVSKDCRSTFHLGPSVLVSGERFTYCCLILASILSWMSLGAHFNLIAISNFVSWCWCEHTISRLHVWFFHHCHILYVCSKVWSLLYSFQQNARAVLILNQRLLKPDVWNSWGCFHT